MNKEHAELVETIRCQRILAGALTTLYADAEGDDVAKLVWGKWAKDAADHLERLSKDSERLAEIIRDLDGLIEHAQQILGNHLPPDGMSKDDAINMLLELLDGPDQREIQSRARTALQLHKGE